MNVAARKIRSNSLEREARRKEWERKRDVRLAELAERKTLFLSPKYKELLADPTYRKKISKSKKTFRIRGDELVFGLTQAMNATGDPIFDDELRALRAYGLDTGG